MIDYIVTHAWLFITLVGILGLLVGSFLNVVIHRLPIMLERDWQQQCLEFLNKSIEEKNESTHFSLSYPASHCPFCRTKLRIWHNIPILSYLLLGGRCADCNAKIPFRYLLVEILCCFLSAVAAYQFGISVELVAVLLLTWFLIAISFIDLEHQLLLDSLVYPLLWLGLFFSCFNLFSDSHDAILGAIIGYAFFWIIDKVFKLITKKEGIGQGDLKLLAAAGAWLGWQILPFMILTSSILGLIVGSSVLLITRKSKETPIPFGPFIAVALWLGIIWGFDLTQAYLHLFGITWSNI